MSTNRPYFADLADLDEDKRIEVIGRTVMEGRKRSAVCVEADEPEKLARYVRKLTEHYPGIVIGAARPGPVEGTVTVYVDPPPVNTN